MDEAAVLNHGKTPHAVSAHQFDRVEGGHLGGDGERISGHDLGNRGVVTIPAELPLGQQT